MKNKSRIKSAVAAAALATASSQAATIAINFTGGGYGPVGQDVTQEAFGFAAAEWENYRGADTAGDDTTAFEGVAFTFTSNNDWTQNNAGGSGYTGTTGEDEVSYGYLDDGGAGVKIAASGLSAWLAANGASEYRVQLIASQGNGGSGTYEDVTLLDSSGGSNLGTFSVTMTPGGTNTANTWQGGSNYITGLTSDTFYVDGNVRDGANRSSIAGIIITTVPEPSSSALIGLAGLGLLIRRNRG